MPWRRRRHAAHPGDELDALVAYLESSEPALDDKNRAIWLLGELPASSIFLTSNGSSLGVGPGAMIINGEMSAPDQLAWVQRIINGELAWLLDEARQPGANRKDLQKAILKCSAEVRQQSVVHTNLLRAITDRQLVQGLQQAVIDAIAAEPREVAQRILDRLKARRRHGWGCRRWMEGGSDVS